MLTTKLGKLVEDLGEKMKAREWKLVTAESCTGGGLSFWITSVSGASKWFDRGFVTYSDTSKTEMLGVHFHIVEKFGSVSEQVVLAMAENALDQSSADVSLAITGIAGPTGGTTAKPVGYTWIAVAGRTFKSHTECRIFPGNRESIRDQAIFRTIHQLYLML